MGAKHVGGRGRSGSGLSRGRRAIRTGVGSGHAGSEADSVPHAPLATPVSTVRRLTPFQKSETTSRPLRVWMANQTGGVVGLQLLPAWMLSLMNRTEPSQSKT